MYIYIYTHINQFVYTCIYISNNLNSLTGSVKVLLPNEAYPAKAGVFSFSKKLSPHLVNAPRFVPDRFFVAKKVSLNKDVASYCWWFRNRALVELGSLSVYLILYDGFFPSQVVNRISSVNGDFQTSHLGNAPDHLSASDHVAHGYVQKDALWPVKAEMKWMREWKHDPGVGRKNKNKDTNKLSSKHLFSPHNLVPSLSHLVVQPLHQPADPKGFFHFFHPQDYFCLECVNQMGSGT